ncbi:MqnA/MqnD/SBP family protein [Pyrobaculum aerophilum]|uniref:Chorismate dehydratase n=1 Tax=Pyrobaculum aerophilum TaxID=13773 RepID=A0A371QXY4_9CREN|nr:menaquinone biosynthetic enzyme MqnA/MqnD family protein [Pyrobaculum aerophilum]RFA95318.1 ABC transporter substrate-binding protein [Pyrobaculum aerophilum]
MKVVRIKYAHSEPLFWRARLNVVEAGNLESARLIAEGVAEVGYVPITLAAELGLPVVPRLAIYSAGPMYSARLFAGRGGGGPCAVSETTVSARVLTKLMGISFRKIDDPWRGLEECSQVLAVGDEALKMVDKGVGHITDVGELWWERVGTPLFFAVLVARRWDAEVKRAVEEMENSVAAFYENPLPLVEQVARRLGVRRELVEEYYMRSRYFVPRDGIRHMEREAEILGLPRLKFLDV